MTVDISEFEAACAKKGPTCSFALFKFTPEQQTKVDLACFTRPDISHIAVSKVLNSWGFKVSDSTVSRHRRRECQCAESKTGKS